MFMRSVLITDGVGFERECYVRAVEKIPSLHLKVPLVYVKPHHSYISYSSHRITFEYKNTAYTLAFQSF